MSGPLTFAGALALWNSARAALDEAGWDAFAQAELRILDHRPASAEEAAGIVAVLLDQGGDPRTDGRDLSALGHLLDFLGGAGAPSGLPGGA